MNNKTRQNEPKLGKPMQGYDEEKSNQGKTNQVYHEKPLDSITN